MNKHHIPASLAALLLGARAFAQNWYDAATLPLYGGLTKLDRKSVV